MGSSKKKSSFRIDDLLQQHAKIATSTSTDRENLNNHRTFYSRPIDETAMMNAYYNSLPGGNKAPSTNGSTSATNSPKSQQLQNNHLNSHPTQNPSHHKHRPSLLPHQSQSSSSSNATTAASVGIPSPHSSATSPITSNNHNGSPFADGLSGSAPHKPMPMYVPLPNALMDLHKANFCFPPMPMGMPPPFPHAATYLEHYANSFQKGNCS